MEDEEIKNFVLENLVLEFSSSIDNVGHSDNKWENKGALHIQIPYPSNYRPELSISITISSSLNFRVESRPSTPQS